MGSQLGLCSTLPKTEKDWFFSDKLQELELAVQLCQGCPIKDSCAELGRTERYGVWGGFVRQTGLKNHASAKEREVCFSGKHDWTTENTFIQGKIKRCLRCKEERDFENNNRLVKLSKKRQECFRGHPWILENLKYDSKTREAFCKICRAEDKAAERARQGPCDVESNMHLCTSCDRYKSRSEFWTDNSKVCKHLPVCRSCVKSKNSRRTRSQNDEGSLSTGN